MKIKMNIKTRKKFVKGGDRLTSTDAQILHRITKINEIAMDIIKGTKDANRVDVVKKNFNDLETLINSVTKISDLKAYKKRAEDLLKHLNKNNSPKIKTDLRKEYNKIVGKLKSLIKQIEKKEKSIKSEVSSANIKSLKVRGRAFNFDETLVKCMAPKKSMFQKFSKKKNIDYKRYKSDNHKQVYIKLADGVEFKINDLYCESSRKPKTNKRKKKPSKSKKSKQKPNTVSSKTGTHNQTKGNRRLPVSESGPNRVIRPSVNVPAEIPAKRAQLGQQSEPIKLPSPYFNRKRTPQEQETNNIFPKPYAQPYARPIKTLSKISEESETKAPEINEETYNVRNKTNEHTVLKKADAQLYDNVPLDPNKMQQRQSMKNQLAKIQEMGQKQKKHGLNSSSSVKINNPVDPQSNEQISVANAPRVQNPKIMTRSWNSVQNEIQKLNIQELKKQNALKVQNPKIRSNTHNSSNSILNKVGNGPFKIRVQPVNFRKPKSNTHKKKPKPYMMEQLSRQPPSAEELKKLKREYEVRRIENKYLQNAYFEPPPKELKKPGVKTTPEIEINNLNSIPLSR